jgi:hypothetical protein
MNRADFFLWACFLTVALADWLADRIAGVVL